MLVSYYGIIDLYIILWYYLFSLNNRINNIYMFELHPSDKVESFILHDRMKHFKEEQLVLAENFSNIVASTEDKQTLNNSECMLRNPVIFLGQEGIDSLNPTLQVGWIELLYAVNDELIDLGVNDLSVFRQNMSSLEKLQHGLFLGVINLSSRPKVSGFIETSNSLLIDSFDNVSKTTFDFMLKNQKLSKRILAGIIGETEFQKIIKTQ